ncbi:DUF4304 domain-containing protein [Balneolaceae bacterium ANBcel3]|nr:DUF4304 domain-containing protein [Balneolaceae bacterium ANBcel3]
MATITELRTTIAAFVGATLQKLEFKTDFNPVFYRHQEMATYMISVTFLKRHQASYFSSNTASFCLETGIYFQKQQAPDQMHVPSIPECHVRGNILRTFKQVHPLKASRKLGWFHPEYKRKDIWWVDREGEHLDALLDKIPFHLERYGLPWLETYSDPAYILWVLKKKKECDPHTEGPFNIGKKGSPARLELIQHLQELTGETTSP